MQYMISILLTVISGTLVFIIQNLLRENRRLRDERKVKNTTKQDAIANGVVSLLKIQLIEYHRKYMQDGEIPTYVYENWTTMYDAYTALGGNGTVKHMNDDINELVMKNK